MEPVFLDLHIHTSEDPNSLNKVYDFDALISRIESIADGSSFLISFTDHNTINKEVYIQALERVENILLGAELHIEYDKTEKPYHCHIYFNLEKITASEIDIINRKLDTLYPDKIIKGGASNIPHIEEILKIFNEHDFILLPHGGQSHSTFNTAIPKDSRFDTAIERSIYYNQFDGFTARSNDGLEQTIEYFKRLGISGFVNLVTCSDNYNPNVYPAAKAKKAGPFIPTWMLALPNFHGLRISLSESSRLIYGKKPKHWVEYIGKVKLSNSLIDIDVDLTPGLNVVIGGSSSGKTLLVDSIYRKVVADFGESNYLKYGVDAIKVNNPSRAHPHYIHQNYIIELIKDKNEKGIADLEIIKNIFPGDKDLIEQVRIGLSKFKSDISAFVDSIKEIENLEKELSHIPSLNRLIFNNKNNENILKSLLPNHEEIERIEYSIQLYQTHINYLSEIEEFIENNAFTSKDKTIFIKIRDELKQAHHISLFEPNIRRIINKYKNEIDGLLTAEDQEQQVKKRNFSKLLTIISKYMKYYSIFKERLSSLSQCSITCKTQEIQVMGHTLFIENNIKVTKENLLEVINKYLKTENKIDSFNLLQPDQLFELNYKKQTPKVKNYDDFVSRVYGDFESMNKTIYKIITKEGKNFEDLSAGWKTSVLLDLMLGYDGDLAPLIIDQPEDNLATDYINHGLIEAIKKIKFKKQIILVSHNATIPMLGDAQNVIICKSNGKIIIRSNMLEGYLNKKSIVDYVAEITDGGKPSIKKRVKKYNLKQFRGVEM